MSTLGISLVFILIPLIGLPVLLALFALWELWHAPILTNERRSLEEIAWLREQARREGRYE